MSAPGKIWNTTSATSPSPLFSYTPISFFPFNREGRRGTSGPCKVGVDQGGEARYRGILGERIAMSSTVRSLKKAPGFTLPDQDGAPVTLSKIESDFTVIYFYPKDDTPGCTIEAKEFSSEYRSFKRKGITVLGVSGGNVRSKEKFCDKYDLSIPLLADESFQVAKKFGSFGQKSFMGRKYQGIFRRTFILDRNKKVIKVFDSVSPKGHAQEVLEFIEGLSARASAGTKRVGKIIAKPEGKSGRKVAKSDKSKRSAKQGPSNKATSLRSRVTKAKRKAKSRPK